MKLWLLDADIIIDFLSMGIFHHLARNHKICAASTVVNEVVAIPRDGVLKGVISLGPDDLYGDIRLQGFTTGLNCAGKALPYSA